MFLKHALAVACCSAISLPAVAAEVCSIAGYEVPITVCNTHNRTLASTCFNCHGPNGVSSAAIPGLAGQDKAYFITAMKEFRDGTREATVMQKYAMGFTDEEYETLTALFHSMQINLAENTKGEKK